MDELVHTHEETSDIDLLHEIGSRMAAADPFHEVLQRVIEMVTAAVRCDSCFIYVLEKEKLVMRASKNQMCIRDRGDTDACAAYVCGGGRGVPESRWRGAGKR